MPPSIEEFFEHTQDNLKFLVEELKKLKSNIDEGDNRRLVSKMVLHCLKD